MARNPLLPLVAMLVTVQTAHADRFFAEQTDDTSVSPRRSESVWFDGTMRSGIGIGIVAGGGVVGFVDDSLRSTTGDVGGMWSLRGALGTHVPLALELGYMGSATPIDTEFGRADALMMGTAIEAAVRYSITPKARFSPYVFGGIGWQRFTIDDTAFQLSDVGIGNQDDLLVMPLGLGMAYRFGPIVTDVRGTFRAATGADLVLQDPAFSLATGGGTFAPMHTWDASLNIGYEL